MSTFSNRGRTACALPPDFSVDKNITSTRGLTSPHPPSKPRVCPKSGWDAIDSSTPTEEETIPTYRPERFHPPSSATVWLCHDLMGSRYTTLKVYTTLTADREIQVYKHIDTVQSIHADLSCLRPLLDVFHVYRVQTKCSVHACLVHPSLGLSLDQLTPLLPPDGVMSSGMVRTTMRNVFAALDFLHAEARVIHTDIQPNNILFGIKGDSILSTFEESEMETPVPRKVLHDRTIYLSHPLRISYGTSPQGDIMPDCYRAPEVGIWKIGDPFERRHLSKARNPEGKLDDCYHLADMQAVLGRASVEFLDRSERRLDFWGPRWFNLESLEERLQGDEKADFLRFLRRMLCWVPEERPTAKELSFDPWIMQGLFR
ncbi:kinase-like domain-containing protein [Aspergillus floccosus]